MTEIEQSLANVFNNLENELKNIHIDTSKAGVAKVINSRPQLKSVLQKLRGKEKQQPLNEEVGIALMIGIIVAVPKIMELVGKSINAATSKGGLFTKIKGYFVKNKDQAKGKRVGDSIIQAAHKLHSVYIKGIKLALRLVPGFNNLEDHTKDKVATVIFNTTIAYLLVNSGLGVYHSLAHGEVGMAGIEAALTAIKNGEIEAYLADAIGVAILSLGFDNSAISHDDQNNVDTSSFTGFKGAVEKSIYRPKVGNEVVPLNSLKNRIKNDINLSLEDLKYGLFEGTYPITKNNLRDADTEKLKSEVIPQIKSIQSEMIAEEQNKIDVTGGKRTKTQLNILKNMSMHVGMSSKGKYVMVKIDYVPHGKHNPYEKH